LFGRINEGLFGVAYVVAGPLEAKCYAIEALVPLIYRVGLVLRVCTPLFCTCGLNNPLFLYFTLIVEERFLPIG